MSSIRFKLTLAVVVLLALFLGLILLSNSLLLEPYYVLQTQGPFLQVLKRIRETPEKPQELLAAVRQTGSETGFKIMISDREGTVLHSSAPEFREGDTSPLPKDQFDYFQEHRQDLTANTTLFNVLDKSPRGQSVVQLMARLPSGLFLVITQPLGQLRRNVGIATTFFVIIGGLMFAIGIAAVLFLSGKMTRPILELTDVARKIAWMDFTSRYTGKREDEIGVLGTSINTISEELSRTITDLKQANEEIKNQMAVQKKFMASVSHEFKTPVALIRGYAEALTIKGDTATSAQIIIREADRLDRLVSDIMAVIKMETHVLPIEVRMQELEPFLAGVASRFETQALEKKAKLRITADPAIEIEIDSDRMTQVMDNLLSNAIRFVPENGKIMIRASKSEQQVRIEVENEGDPIPEEHIANLFTPFYRVDDSRSRKSGGTGLGLAVAKGIVTAHNGTCGVNNTSTGVCFWLEIPMHSDK